MKIMENRCLTVLLLSTLTFFLMVQFPILTFGGGSNGARLTYGQTHKQKTSANSETWRTCSLPPAWGNLDPKQQESPTHKDFTLAVRINPYRWFN